MIESNQVTIAKGVESDMSAAQTSKYLQIGSGFELALRPVVVKGEIVLAPKGVSRNARSNCWQIKVVKDKRLVATGSMSDTQPTAQENLDLVIQELARQVLINAPDLVNAVKAVKGKSLKIQQGSGLRLRWHVVKVTPTLVIGVYNPVLGREIKVMVANDKKVTQENFQDSLRKALVLEERISRGLTNPNNEAVVTEQELESKREQADKLSKLAHVQEFLGFGAEIRAELESARGEVGKRGRKPKQELSPLAQRMLDSL